MTALQLAKALVDTLPAGREGLFNPYRDVCQFDTGPGAPARRFERLVLHLTCKPRFILLGEAPGYQGCRYSGVTFTSERLLIEGAIPRIPTIHARLSRRRLPFSEPSATIVWKTLYQLQIADEVLLWNAVQLHPHEPGKPWTNRTPTASELQIGRTAIVLLREAFPDVRLVAVGNNARDSLKALGFDALPIRHPARGGAPEFSEGLAAVCRTG